VVDVLVILDGASEPLRAGRTSLERARTPVLDRLAAAGTLTRVRTVPAGLAPGSESAIPTLLGWAPTAPVDRGVVEAAAREVALGPDERAWRVDVDGGRADDRRVENAAAELGAAAPRHRVTRIGGHRLLVCGRPPLPDAFRRAGLVVWPEGMLPPRVLGPATVVIAARGAAAGLGRLMGATVIVPEGATGLPDTDLAAKAQRVASAIRLGAVQVVVHVGGADEAAHERDPDRKVAFLERVDRELLRSVGRAVAEADGLLRVCPDHGCDPRTGEHDADPVPCLTWTPQDEGGELRHQRLTERAVATLPVADPTAGLVAA
jgi:2,3-bisphosphoglycerate-independent phosphoglycerate mutase